MANHGPSRKQTIGWVTPSMWKQDDLILPLIIHTHRYLIFYVYAYTFCPHTKQWLPFYGWWSEEYMQWPLRFILSRENHPSVLSGLIQLHWQLESLILLIIQVQTSQSFMKSTTQLYNELLRDYEHWYGAAVSMHYKADPAGGLTASTYETTNPGYQGLKP